MSLNLEEPETGHFNGRKGKESISFRFHKPVMDELREEAEQKNESLNVLINKILCSYVKWYKPSYKAGNLFFSKDLLVRIFDALTDEQIADIASEYVKDEFKELIQILGGDCTFPSYVHMMSIWCEFSGFSYTHQNADDNRTHIISIRFDMGRNWSLFMKNFTQKVCEELKVKNLGCTITSSSIIFKYEDG
jgi:hypothetical protein